MGKLKNLQIVFEKNVFCQGDVIVGHLAMELGSELPPKDVKSIRIQFKGFAKLQKNIGATSQAAYDAFAKEVYFEANLDVFGSGQDQSHSKKPPIQPGPNRFPFEYQIPNTKSLPFSFESKVGFVRYWAEATVSVKKFLQSKEYKTLRRFSMIGPPADLNTLADVGNEVTKSVKVRTLGVGPVQNVITVGLPRRGYVPGESITIIGNVENRGGQTQRHFKAKLIQRTTYVHMESGDSLGDKVILSKVEAKVTCKRAQRTDFTVGPLPIPPVPPSGLNGCKLMNIEYFAEIKESDLDKVRFVAVIGTVPLRTLYPAPRASSQPTASPVPTVTEVKAVPSPAANFMAELSARVGQRAPKQATTPAPSNDEVQEGPPPSYEEAVGVASQPTDGQDQEDDVIREDHFVPRYPYFNLASK